MKTIIIMQLLLMCVCMSKAQISSKIEISESDITFSKIKEYDIVSFKLENYYTLETGAPQLPVLIKSYVIPLNANIINIQINDSYKHKLDGKYSIFPVQRPQKVTTTTSITNFEYNDSIYSSNLSYPNEKIRVISDIYEHGHHIVTLEICPFEYIPLKKELYYCNFTYSINYKLNQENKKNTTFKSLKRYKLANAYVSSKVENIHDTALFSDVTDNILRTMNQSNNVTNQPINITEEIIPEYFIITNKKLKPIFQKLADWKTQKGLPTIIKTVEEIEANYKGSDMSEKIRNYLKESRDKWGDDFFVLLGGDTNIVPERLATNGPDRRDEYKKQTDTYIKDSVIAPQDLYYTALEGTWNQNRNDIYNEYYQYQDKNKYPSNLIDLDKASFGRNLYLGRAPVNDSIEALIFVNKVITYEKANANINYSYINNYLVADAFISYENEFLYNDARSYIDSYLKKYPLLNYWLQYDHFNCSCNKHNKYLTQSPGEELNKTNFLSALQNGGNSGLNHFHIIYHMDHSNPKSLGTSSKDKNELINNNDVDKLTNELYYQIILSGGCEPATFTKDCIAEHFLGNPKGGAVAFIGNADRGWSSEYFQLENFLKALYETNENYYNLAYIFQKTIGKRDNNNCRLTLLGDPEMPIWTATPQNLNVSVTTSQKTENSSTVNTITVQINNLPAGQEALACLMKGTEYYTTYTIADTQPHPFSYVPSTSGEVKVTVTAHNYRPFETTVLIDAGSYPHITMEPTVRDSGSNCNGNGDGQLDAGETVELTANLRCAAQRNLTNAQFELVPSSADIKMLDSIVSFNSITLSPTTAQAAKFRFRINKDCKEKLKNELNPMRFKLYMKSDNNAQKYQDGFNADIFAPEIETGNQQIASTSNGNLTIEGNETVNLYVNIRNTGKAEAVELFGKITSDSPYVSECSIAPVSFPNIPKYETRKNTIAFQFRTTTDYISGTPLPLNLEVRNRYGKAWTLPIDPATHPTTVAQSSISFQGYENYINLLWSANSPYYNIFRSDSETGEYVKLNEFPLTNEYFRDDNVSLNSIYYYKIIAINESGNESTPSNPVKAWTTLPMLEGFPVTMSDDLRDFWTRSGVTTCDIDNDGKHEIFALQVAWDPYKSRVVGLNSDGEDLFDIDGNVTTKSGFALWNEYAVAIPTASDLKSDGEMKIITATREGSPNYIRCYSVKDGNNDHLPDLLWEKPTSASYIRSAVIANMDNSSDGSQEIVLMSCEGHGGVSILDYNGNELYSIGNTIINAYSAPAIADLDGDGDMEIIVGNYDGVYIWHHNGTPFSTNPIYTETGYYLSSSPVICDINNDGKKEILIAAKEDIGNNDTTAECIILALNTDGTLVEGWNKTQKSSCSHYRYNYDISVGDLNGDGKPEVVALGVNNLRIWNNKGEKLLDKQVSARYKEKMAPILADVDGDNLCEIILGNEGGEVPTIYAINLDGTSVKGFPLSTEHMFYGAVRVADINNDGKNEIALMTDKIIYVWKTEGNSNCIEWGAERHDHLNTGEYGKTCLPEVIASNTIWNGETPCGSIFIQSGNFTIPSETTLNLNNTSEIVVRSGGTLTIDGATINNAYIRALSGSHVVIKNGGTINLRNASDFIIDLGATLDYQSGAIMPD